MAKKIKSDVLLDQYFEIGMKSYEEYPREKSSSY